MSAFVYVSVRVKSLVILTNNRLASTSGTFHPRGADLYCSVHVHFRHKRSQRDLKVPLLGLRRANPYLACPPAVAVAILKRRSWETGKNLHRKAGCSTSSRALRPAKPAPRITGEVVANSSPCAPVPGDVRASIL